MPNYPLMLKMEGRNVVVVGGGKVAYRKVVSLLEANANVTVVSPHIIRQLLSFVKSNDVKWICAPFQPEYIENAEFIIAATNDRKTNEEVYKAKKPFQWINVVDEPQFCDFFVPATVQRGKLSIAVSTSGASPLLARKIKKEIADLYDERYESYVDFLYKARKIIQTSIPSEKRRKELFQQLIKIDPSNLGEMNKILQSLALKKNKSIHERIEI